MATYSYVARARKHLKLPRQCVLCGHSYAAEYLIQKSSASGAFGTADSVEASVYKQIDVVAASMKHHAYCNDTYGVLCPRCNEFSPAAMQLHFPQGLKHGLLSRLQSTYRLATATEIVKLTLVLSPALLLAYCFYDFAEVRDGPLFYAMVAVIVSLGSLLSVRWVKSRRIPRRIAEVSSFMSTLGENGLADFVRREYWKSNGSLNLETLFGSRCIPISMPREKYYTIFSKKLYPPRLLYNINMGIHAPDGFPFGQPRVSRWGNPIRAFAEAIYDYQKFSTSPDSSAGVTYAQRVRSEKKRERRTERIATFAMFVIVVYIVLCVAFGELLTPQSAVMAIISLVPD